ncbi:MAG: hypothetical protein KF821_10855 [Anaerolineales bacterium]|nr:hypothetical protein [Anaerolineales bacterium]
MEEHTSSEILSQPPQAVQIPSQDIEYIQVALNNVRDEIRDNPYIKEASRVLSVGGYRSAIGSYWNAVVDDLRRKILHRSLDLFNKERPGGSREIRTYEDFQEHVTDYDLIEGAYKIGVLDWEAKKVLHQARETRHIFDGHPKSSDPSVVKVMNLMIDCNQYVLSVEPPPAIIDINAYIAVMDSDDFMQEKLAVQQSLGDLPEIYKIELINRFLTIYQHEATSTRLRSNIELCAPLLWEFLQKETKHQVGGRVDKELQQGQARKSAQAIRFLSICDGSLRYTSTATRQIVFNKEIEALENNLDSWDIEAKIVSRIEQLGMSIPDMLLDRYVRSLMLTYVGYQSYRNYYSWAAAPIVIRLFENFDERAAIAFTSAIAGSSILRQRIRSVFQLERLRTIARLVIDKLDERSAEYRLLTLLLDKEKVDDFFTTINSRPTA